MRTFAALAAAGAILLTQAASAATVPKISGVYNVSTTTQCQASIPLTLTNACVFPSGSDACVSQQVITVDVNQPNNPGSLTLFSATVTFDAGKATGEGTVWEGDLVWENSNIGQSPGLTTQAWSFTGTYSNTATQLTLTSTVVVASYVFQVRYADIVVGVAQHADLVWVDTVHGCIEQGTAVRQ
jgi:hypothetical protein